jgi:hypothetical protein
MEACGGVELYLRSFLTSALGGVNGKFYVPDALLTVKDLRYLLNRGALLAADLVWTCWK